jgi:hypothetical protein
MANNGMRSIAEAIQQKNAMGIKSATPSANQGTGLSGTADLERIASDSNANASPAKNAGDLDIVAMKLIEHEKVFEIIMPGLDEMKYKVDAIWDALTQAQGGGVPQAQGGTAAPAPQAQPPVPPQGV